MLRFQRFSARFVAIACAVLFAGILIYPRAAIGAALNGISIWWDVLFPALFPFLVISEVMLGFGIVHFLGTLFDPVMRPLFRVPGIGGFVFAMGFAAGYPVGSKLTAQLMDQQLMLREEGERLVAFTSTSDPIFLISAVSIGFFHDPALAVVLAAAHYGTAVLVGILMRFYKGRVQSPPPPRPEGPRVSIMKRAFQAMHAARMKDGRDLGTLLQESVVSSLQLIMVIGGLVVFLSVILEMLIQMGWMDAFVLLISGILESLGLPAALSEAVVNGLFEVTLGSKSAGSLAGAVGLQSSAAAAAFVLSWSGLSVHAQIVSIMSRAGLRYGPFLFARALHGLLAALAVMLIWEEVYPAAAVWMEPVRAFSGAAGTPAATAVLGSVSAGMAAAVTVLLLLLSPAAAAIRRLIE